MKLAIIGSRGLYVRNIGDHLPPGVTELVSGGARGVDSCVRDFAQERGIPLREFLPDYPRYGRGAPLRRNREIVCYADEVLAFWDGQSRGTAYVLKLCERLGKPVRVILLPPSAGSGQDPV